MSRTAYLAIPIALTAALTGCVTFDPNLAAAPPLPDRHDVRLDQLIVHSNFELPEQHRLLQELNAQRADLSNKLALPISDEPVHVYLFADAERFGQFMQGRYPDFPQRRAFFVETDTKLTVFAHWGDRVAEDLRHEVAHGYLHSVVQNLPLWLDEGLAEYFEVPRGTQGLNAAHVEALASLLKEGRWSPDLRRLEALASAADMSQHDYAEAWLWVHWMLESEPRRRLLQNYLGDLRREGVTPPMSLYLRQLGGESEVALVIHLRALDTRAR